MGGCLALCLEAEAGQLGVSKAEWHWASKYWLAARNSGPNDCSGDNSSLLWRRRGTEAQREQKPGSVGGSLGIQVLTFEQHELGFF